MSAASLTRPTWDQSARCVISRLEELLEGTTPSVDRSEAPPAPVPIKLRQVPVTIASAWEMAHTRITWFVSHRDLVAGTSSGVLAFGGRSWVNWGRESTGCASDAPGSVATLSLGTPAQWLP